MISWIKGELVSSWQVNNKFFILINCQGLGYEIQILEPLYLEIKTNSNSYKDLTIWLKHIKKEDSDSLFGFVSREQRDFFIEILSVKGVGSQIGMSLLNKFSINEIINAINTKDKNLISSVQGIGQKMSERIILELKSNFISKIPSKNNLDNKEFLKTNKEISSLLEEIELTLQTLKYPAKQIKSIEPLLIKKFIKQKNQIKDKNKLCFEDFLKEAMNYLDNNNSNLGQ